LPHVDVAWKYVWIGAFVTALLLSIARSLISWYFSYAGTQSVYGAAGSVMVILIGVYYSAQVFFMGAEFTHVYARMGGMKKKLGSPNVKQAGEAVH
jgi:membrane protein